MLHVTRLTTGLQDLLCEGRFVDVRICCSDHSPSDGLGAHRAMLAAASPGLLGPSLQGEESEEEMVCLQLPDYTRYEVNNIHLSRLGESEVYLFINYSIQYFTTFRRIYCHVTSSEKRFFIIHFTSLKLELFEK